MHSMFIAAWTLLVTAVLAVLNNFDDQAAGIAAGAAIIAVLVPGFLFERHVWRKRREQ